MFKTIVSTCIQQKISVFLVRFHKHFKQMISICVISIFFLVVLVSSKEHNTTNDAISSNKEWLIDPAFEHLSSDIRCDFSRIHIQKNNVNDTDEISSLWDDYPIVLSGLTDDWLAKTKWTKQSFLDLYGNRSIRSGSESSIVYSGGVAENFVLLRDLIDKMSPSQLDVNGNTSPTEASFVFDTTILRVIPELTNDFSVPKLFAQWDNPEVEKANQMWHMLSLGPSRSGLPFHHHGRTWLAVVHGAKRWFVYPPGYGPPPEIDALVNPFLSTSRWLEDVYPLLRSYPKPPLYGHLESDNTNTSSPLPTGYRPLECVQRPGEVLFVPDRWAHMTVNVGETIAIGGQELLKDDIRIEGAQNVLARHPLNYEALKDLGLTESNSATGITMQRRHGLVTFEATELVLLSSREDLYAKMRLTRDSWLVLYYHNSTYTDYQLAENNLLVSLVQQAQFEAMSAMASELHGVANVAAMDLTQQQIDLYENFPVFTDAQSGLNHYALPFLKLHRGDVEEEDEESLLRRGEYVIDTEGVLYPSRDIEDVHRAADFVLHVMEEEGLAHGSMTSVSQDMLSKYHRGIEMLRTALSVKPAHPETMNLLCEIIAETGDLEAVNECVLDAAANYRRLDVPSASVTALSAVYYRLAKIYTTRAMFAEALPLLEASLQHSPNHQDALVDHVVALTHTGDKRGAVSALESLRGRARDFGAIPHIGEIERDVAGITE